MTKAAEILERSKVTAHFKDRIKQRTDMNAQQRHTFAGIVADAVVDKGQGRYFVYSKSTGYGALVRKTKTDTELITVYQRGKRTANNATTVLTEGLSFSDDAVAFTLEHFEGFYSEDNVLEDFYCPDEGRCFHLVEVD